MTTPSARQQYHSAHLSSHQHALPSRTSPSRRNNYHTGDIPTQTRGLKWTRNPFSHTRNGRIDEGIKLHERRTEGADVSLGQATPVSRFLFPSGCSTLHISLLLTERGGDGERESTSLSTQHRRANGTSATTNDKYLPS
jgi:hypothetical protein